MVYKAIQAFLSDKAPSFLPGNNFYPEEDKYASQFDPWSTGNRPVSRPWVNISINIQIGYAPPSNEQSNDSHTASSLTAEQGHPQSQTQQRQQIQERVQQRIEEPESPTYSQRSVRQTAYDRIMGHGYGNSVVRGGWAHFGDVHHHYASQSQFMARRFSDPAANLKRPSFSDAEEAVVRNRACEPQKIETDPRKHQNGG